MEEKNILAGMMLCALVFVIGILLTAFYFSGQWTAFVGLLCYLFGAITVFAFGFWHIANKKKKRIKKI